MPAGALLVTGLLSLSLLIFGAFYYFDPMSQRSTTRSRADSGKLENQLDQTPITPVESQFAQLLYGPTNVPVPTPIGSVVPTSTDSMTLATNKPTLDAHVAVDRRSIGLTFGNLINVLRITYDVTYTAKTGLKGATGTIDVASPSAPIKRDITLGTCSKNICVYDDITTPIAVSVVYRMSDGPDVGLTASVQF